MRGIHLLELYTCEGCIPVRFVHLRNECYYTPHHLYIKPGYPSLVAVCNGRGGGEGVGAGHKQENTIPINHIEQTYLTPMETKSAIQPLIWGDVFGNSCKHAVSSKTLAARHCMLLVTYWGDRGLLTRQRQRRGYRGHGGRGVGTKAGSVIAPRSCWHVMLTSEGLGCPYTAALIALLCPWSSGLQRTHSGRQLTKWAPTVCCVCDPMCTSFAPTSIASVTIEPAKWWEEYLPDPLTNVSSVYPPWPCDPPCRSSPLGQHILILLYTAPPNDPHYMHIYVENIRDMWAHQQATDFHKNDPSTSWEYAGKAHKYSRIVCWQQCAKFGSLLSRDRPNSVDTSK